MKYPSVSITALFYAYTFALSSILPAVTSATLFARLYKFTPSQTGLALGVGTLIGSSFGELLGGIVADRSMYLSRKRLFNAEVVPEVRLHGIWLGAFLQAVSLWGNCVNSIFMKEFGSVWFTHLGLYPSISYTVGRSNLGFQYHVFCHTVRALSPNVQSRCSKKTSELFPPSSTAI